MIFDFYFMHQYNLNMNIEISVIVPIHGVEKYLEKCLESLLKQTFNKPYEVICVIDNCDDKSEEIVDRFIKINPNVFNKKIVINKNVSDTRNDGLLIARGKYIAFVDGDDSVKEEYLSKLYDAISTKDLDIACCNFLCLNEKNNKVYKEFTSLFAYKNDKSIKKVKKSFAFDIRVRSFVWNKIYKKQFLIENNISFQKLIMPFEDFIFNFLCFFKTKKDVGFTKCREYLYLQRDGSYTKNENQLMILDALINSISFIKGYELLKGEKFPYLFFYYSKLFLLKYTLLVNKKTIEDYSKARKQYISKFKSIKNAKSINDIEVEVVNYLKTHL